MCFPKNIRKKEMEKAGYFCCVCRRPSVSLEVHHIIPRGKGGDDSIENAAPLCPNCHADYGENPQKRTRIKHIRDWWYGRIEEMYASKVTSPEQLSQVHVLLQSVDTKQNSVLEKQDKHDIELEDLKARLKVITNNMIENMTPATSDITTSSVVSAAVLSVQPVEYKCTRCGYIIDVRNDFCPRCNHYLG